MQTNIFKAVPWLLFLWWFVQVESVPPELRVIVHESSQGSLPSQVLVARRLADEQNIQLRIVDKDVETGDGKTPEELQTAIEAAKDHGLPSLVKIHGRTILAIDLPPTAEDILR